MRAWWLGLVCAGWLLSLAACSNPTDHKQNYLPGGDAGSATDVALAGDASATDAACDCLKPGLWFRFDTLQLESLNNEPHPITVLLNPLWQTDINNHELNFYAEVTAVTADGVDVHIVNGARVGTQGDTCLLEYTGTYVHFPRKGCQLLLSDPAEMNVYAGTQATPKNCSVAPYPAVKHVIPIKKARLHLDMAQGCGKFGNGRLDEGNFSKYALEHTCTCVVTNGDLSDKCGTPDAGYVPDPAKKDQVDQNCGGCNTNFHTLGGFINDIGELTYDKCTSTDGSPAVCLTATFSGVRIDGPPAACPK